MERFDYSKIDVAEFLNELGLNNIEKRYDQYWFSCPLPQHIGEDHTPSISMEEDTTRVYCFGCRFAGNAVSFLSELENVTPLKARHWLREKFNIGVGNQENFSDQIMKKMERIKKKHNSVIDQTEQYAKILSEDEIKKRYIDWNLVHEYWTTKLEEINPYPFAYMLDRGFSPKILQEFEIGWDDISQSITIPIRDEHNNLVGFKGRFVDPNSKSRYKVLGGAEYGFDTFNVSKVLHGLPKALENIYIRSLNPPTAIVVEGELNCISMHQKGYFNTVGISGKTIHKEQSDLIKKYFAGAIFIFDEFKDTINAASEVSQHIMASVVPEHEKDPAEMDQYEIAYLLGQRTSVFCYNNLKPIITK